MATTEERRLREARDRKVPWRKWGPYLSERQWGTVREDYSQSGNAWDYFSHDQARSRAYRWGEDGLAGFSDDRQRLCFALALWNGKDPILKEGDKAKAEQWLTQSAKLLPTAPAAFFLGNVARDKGDTQSALKLYQAAATSKSDIGQSAAGDLVRLDLPQNPGKYLATAPQLAANGRLVLVIENQTPLSLTYIQVTPVVVDAAGNIVRQANPVAVGRTLKPGERVAVDAGVESASPQQLSAIRFRIDKAQVAED